MRPSKLPSFLRPSIRSKYRVSPPAERQARGRTYASKAEKRYGDELYLQKISGEIIEIIEQPRFWLGVPENVYIADFLVITDQPHVVDVKGMWTAKFK